MTITSTCSKTGSRGLVSPSLLQPMGHKLLQWRLPSSPTSILMDLTLPDIRGEEATQRIKADPTTKQIPVISLTANAMAGDREKAIAAGCDDFDTKPVEMSRLLEKIKALKPH